LTRTFDSGKPERCVNDPILFLSFGELAARRDSVQWIVQDLIPAGSFVILAGPPKLASKSFKTLDLAIAVANGEPFLGQPSRKRKVLYVALEDGPIRLSQRLHQLGVAPDDSRVMPMAFFGRRGGQAAMQILADATPADPYLVIIDPLINWLGQAGLKDENEALQIANFIEQYRELVLKSGSTIFVNDHMDKTWNGMRGSGAKNGSSDGWIDARPVGKEGEGYVRLKATLRDGGRAAEIGVQLTTTPCRIDCPICSTWSSPTDKVQIRFKVIPIDQMPKKFEASEAQLAGNGRGQGSDSRQNAKPAKRTKEEDRDAVMGLLGSEANGRWTPVLIGEALKMSDGKVVAALRTLVSSGEVLPMQGTGASFIGYRLRTGEVGRMAEASPGVVRRQPLPGGDAEGKPEIAPPDPIADDQSLVTEEELARYNVTGERQTAATMVSRRLAISISDAYVLLRRAKIEQDAVQKVPGWGI
jgi:hypothetical protein